VDNAKKELGRGTSPQEGIGLCHAIGEALIKTNVSCGVVILLTVCRLSSFSSLTSRSSLPLYPHFLVLYRELESTETTSRQR
jgi:hypothetical protein